MTVLIQQRLMLIFFLMLVKQQKNVVLSVAELNKRSFH